MSTDSVAALGAEALEAMAAAAAAQAAAVVGGMPGPFGGGVPPPIAMSFFHVLTVPEAAKFLRVSESVVVSEAEAGRLPGRKLKTEWRFLEFALAEWLRTGHQAKPETKPTSSKERMLFAFGAWKGFGEDPEKVIEELSRARKAVSAKKG